MAWATPADVIAITGATVTTAQLSQALPIVEMFAGITEDNTTTLADSDLRMLRYATAYQAAWMAAQVDVTSRTDVAQLEQDGSKVTPADADSLILAPLARRALLRLSWRRPGRSIQLTRPGCSRTYTDLSVYAAAFLRDDLPGNWRPL